MNRPEMRAPQRLGPGALAVPLAASILLLLAAHPEAASQSAPRQEPVSRAIASPPATSLPVRAPPQAAAGSSPAPRPPALALEHPGEDDTHDLLRSALAGDVRLEELLGYQRAPLMSEADRIAYLDLLSDPEMHELVRQDLLHPAEPLHASQRGFRQLIEVDYLRGALAWEDNPLREELLEMIAGTILADSFEPGLDLSARRTIATVKMELYETLEDHAPSRAHAVVEEARGTRLEDLLAFISVHVRQRRQTSMEVEKIPPRPTD